MKIIQGLLIYTYIGIIVGFATAIPIHVVDETWSAHAQNHVLQTLVWMIGYSIIGIVLVLIPFGRKELWSWWLLLFSGVMFYIGYFGSIYVTDGGAPGPRDDIFFGVNAVVFVVCLLVAKKQFSK